MMIFSTSSERSLQILRLCVVFCLIIFIVAEIHDPLNIFCGSKNCYDVIGVNKDANIKDIKKAYRKLSLSHHPDKNKEENATETFRIITKAFEVLTGNESRPLFDYYLKHPKDYFKVSGQHYIQAIPKSDVRIVLFFVALLISGFLHWIQKQKYEKLVKFLNNATINNLNVKNGGTKQTMELFRRASDLYDAHIKDLKSKGDKSAGKTKMQKDPAFIKIVENLVSDMKIEGGSKKPEVNDLFIVQLIYFPYNFYLWAVKYHRRYISKNALPLEDCIDMASSAVGLHIWDEMSEAERTKLMDMKIWLPEVLANWKNEKNAAILNKMKKKGKKVAIDDDEDEYIE